MTDATERFAERARRERQARRRRMARRSAAVVAPLVLIATVGFSPLLDVDEVRIVGTSRLPRDQVVAAARIPDGRALALVDLDEVRRRVRSLSYVRSARVRRQWPGRVVIEVHERVPALAVPVGGGVALYDAEGVRLGGARSVPRGVPLLRVAGGRPTAELVQTVVAVVGTIPADIRRHVLGYSATSPDDVTFALVGGREVVWGSAEDGAAKALVLPALLRRPGTHYDVRAPTAPAVR
ncbi:MAG TPA: FtsQ-type POTRA domain-containing protein [Mycobacteriales bacterium]|nr:FtsQ-type POTRA domain-containing protein [Mycobacteriales bacterium]